MAQNRSLIPFGEGRIDPLSSSLEMSSSALAAESSSPLSTRIANRLGTEADAIVGTSNVGALAQRGAALLHGHSFSLQERAIGHVWDAVYAETDGRKQEYLAGLADQTIHQLNRDLQDVTNDAVQRIRGVLQREGLPPEDTRPWWQKALQALPDE